MNSIGYFEIHSSDPEREIRFYQSVFGWKFIQDENIPVEYYRIITSGINGGLLKRPDKQPPAIAGINAFVCSVEVSNFDAIASKILEQGGQIALPKFAIPYRCWQGYFTDPDNNAFGIFEVDERVR